MWPNLSMADFDLVDLVCYVAELTFFKLNSVADMDVAEFVYGRF